MKNWLLIFLVGGFANSIIAQDLHVYYDVVKDTMRYVQSGQPIQSPKVKSGAQVHLHVENYNDYIYKLVIEVEEKSYEVPSGGMNAQLFSGLMESGSPLEQFMSRTEGMGDNPFGALLGMGGEENKGAEDVMGALESKTASKIQSWNQRFNTALQRIEATEANIREINHDMEEIVETQKIKSFVGQEMVELKYHPELQPAQIKKLSNEYMSKVFGVEKPDELTLSELLQRSNTKNQLREKISDYKRLTQKLQNHLREINNLQDSMATLNLDAGPIDDFKRRILQANIMGAEHLNEYKQNIQAMEQELPKVDDLNIRQLTKMRYLYEEINAHTFGHTHHHPVQGDELKFSLRLVPTDSAMARGVQPKELAPLRMPVYGGFKVNASLGVSFGSFFNVPQTFFVRDSVIRSEDKDKFLPILSSFYHFYKQTSGNFSVGGSFGIGLSLGGDSGIQSATFFLGPSFILGRTQRVVISTGIMGSKVTRLSQGYQIGDRFLSDANIVPTKSVYELGYFLGLSFNLLSSSN